MSNQQHSPNGTGISTCRDMETGQEQGNVQSVLFVRKSSILPKLFPFCGVIREDWCKRLKYRNGIHFQCKESPSSGSSFSDIEVKPLTSVNIIVQFLLSPPNLNNSGFFCSLATCRGSR